MGIREKIGKGLQSINEANKQYMYGNVQYIRVDYVERLLLEILDEEEKENGKQE
jgi:hypothetical protein